VVHENQSATEDIQCDCGTVIQRILKLLFGAQEKETSGCGVARGKFGKILLEASEHLEFL